MTGKQHRPLVVLNLAAFSGRLLASGDCPRILAFAEENETIPVRPVFPALTLPMQATFMTGAGPRDHGIVGNGFFDRQWLEHRFWNASAGLLEQPALWQRTAGARHRVAALFWWHCLGSGLDTYLNVAPIHTHDGGTVSSCACTPPELYATLEKKLGPFPLHRFWGPGISIESSAWILNATREIVETRALDLIYSYIPHMDYSLQRSGPSSSEARAHLAELDELLAPFLDRAAEGAFDLILLSEYGITPVQGAVRINRILREEKLFQVRCVGAREYPDLPHSKAFALCDHQAAHLYIASTEVRESLAALLAHVEGVGAVLDEYGKKQAAIDHPRSGELVLQAAPGWWFDYTWWDDAVRAPDYARTVDIHRKIGYDPLELLADPGGKGIAADPGLIKGSHGLIPADRDDFPLWIASRSLSRGLVRDADGVVAATEVYQGISQGLEAREKTV